MGEAPESARPPPSEEARRPISLLAGATWTIALVLLGVVVLQITEQVRPGAVGDLVNVAAVHVLVHSLVIFAMLRMYAPHSSMRSALGARAVSPLHVTLAAIVGAAMEPAIAALDALVEKRMPMEQEETEMVARLLSTTAPGARIVMAVVFVALLPLTIELFFRGIVYGGVRMGRTPSAAILSTTIYFVATQEPRSMLGALVLGLVLGWLRAQSGSVVSAIAAHVAFAAVPMVPILRGTDPMADYAYPPRWTAGALGVAIVCLLLARFVALRDARAIAAGVQDEGERSI